jgi:hypothetical protein
MNTKKTITRISFLSILGLIFVVLKLTDSIDWSWWYVTLPFWGLYALVGVIVLLIWCIGFLYGFFFK